MLWAYMLNKRQEGPLDKGRVVHVNCMTSPFLFLSSSLGFAVSFLYGNALCIQMRRSSLPFQSLLKTLKTTKKPIPNSEEFPDLVFKAIIVSDLNSSTLNLILSDPQLKASKCLDFFEFILKNQSLISFELDLQSHLTVICRLLKARLFSPAARLLHRVSVDQNLRYPFPAIASCVEKCGFDAKVVAKLFNSMLNVYSRGGKFEQVLETFGYVKENGIRVDERSCTMTLLNMRRSDEVGLALHFFNLMVEAGFKVSVYSLTVVVHALCTVGEIKKAKMLVEQMMKRGIRANVVTYNILLDYCSRRWEFQEQELILGLMKKEGEKFNVNTYKILFSGFISCGKVDEAEILLENMHEKGLGRYRSMEAARNLFTRMVRLGVKPDAATFSALIHGSCNGYDDDDDDDDEVGMAVSDVVEMEKKRV